jgi:hypothetical protein
MADQQRTEFDYLLNSMEHAAREAHPAKAGYAGKRKALFAYVRELERKAALYDARGVQPSQAPSYTWPPKACPCGTVMQGECLDDGCKWQRDPSLVPEALRVPLGVHPPEAPSREDLVSLLDEVRQCFTRDDALPDDLLPRIDTAIDGVQENGK